jgi:hypothetical protein
MTLQASSLRGAPSPLPAFMEQPTLGFELSNWLAGLLVLVLGVIVPLVVVARHNRLFFGGGGASLPKRSH